VVRAWRLAKLIMPGIDLFLGSHEESLAARLGVVKRSAAERVVVSGLLARFPRTAAAGGLPGGSAMILKAR